MSYDMAGPWDGWQSWYTSALDGESPTTPSSIDTSVTAYLAAGVARMAAIAGTGQDGTPGYLLFNPIAAPRRAPVLLPEGAAADLRPEGPLRASQLTAEGVWVHIEGCELQRIQLDNFRAGRRSMIQLHTHPSADVRMSNLDRAWEVVRHVGALSIIVPHYCRFGLQLGTSANIYEREEDDWRLWSTSEARERLVVV